MIKVGDTLTIRNDHVQHGGNIIFHAGQKVEIRELMIINGCWSGLRWIPEKIIGVKLIDHYGVYPLDCFIEEINLNIKTNN